MVFRQLGKQLLENHDLERVRERTRGNVCCAVLEEEKRTKRDEPGDRVARNNKERRTKCVRENQGGSLGVPNDRDDGAYEVVRPFKSRFFWLHRHPQNSLIYRSMLNKTTSTNRLCSAWQLRPISNAINSSFLLTADYSYLSCFYLVHQVSSARKIIGLRSRQERNKPPTYLYYEREKYGGKKRQITRKVEPLRLSWY